MTQKQQKVYLSVLSLKSVIANWIVNSKSKLSQGKSIPRVDFLNRKLKMQSTS